MKTNKYRLSLLTIFLSLLISSSVLAKGMSTAAQAVDSFEQLFGVTHGKRRNHTKGFCFKGKLVPVKGSIQQYSISSLFSGESNVIGRLSHKGGNDAAPDNKHGEYGMGLSISTPSGEQHLMSLNTLDFFPVATPEAFAELMAIKAKKSPEAAKAFKQKNKYFKRFKDHAAKKVKTLKPYEGNTFNSVNSFYLVNKEKNKTAIRWSFVPSTPQKIVTEPNPDFFFDNMQKNLAAQGIIWDMVITIANPEDAVDNAAIPWVGKHQKIIAAKLKVTSISSEQSGTCDSINYDPLVLSSGFHPSEDPLLQARRNAYAISFGKRMTEKQGSNP